MDWTVMQRHCTAEEGHTPTLDRACHCSSLRYQSKAGGAWAGRRPNIFLLYSSGGHCYVLLVCAPTEPGAVETASTHCCTYCAPGCVVQLSLDGRCIQALRP